MIRRTLLALAPVALLAVYALALRTAHAQPSPNRVLVLARTCAGEAGWSTRTGDCAAIVHVLLRRADRAGTTPIAMARAYSAALGPGGRPWVRGLALDGHEPAGWPRDLRWERYQPGWLALVSHVRDVLAGRVADPCPGAVHWGMRTGRDAERARRAGWRLVECARPTRNAFWRLPGAGDAAEGSGPSSAAFSGGESTGGAS